ncbi:putative Phospholipase D/nuclease [Thiomonas arsenitoxydans]|uniref:phospholipase D n=1 Tax=Thiomonas arsenitoxydans (strain DSM 22701 / CIP 110005 / 3As) TaxID=426114 RepID=D6CTL7_THIA3|nr:phospholipase D-like domain-containing protein [Thiomonas arsenitoxydans]CQR44477.1 putative Phospholipase D/nuclease [Thiomonas sp. CB3]CAZ88636.1 putative Phospholipase D/nuclease [Thiomonas arsenitoxydans]CQR27748.1 putative Phospholipase D/nuclease [Thiomonas arsenitoxydans]CQR32044.1 putative Phospholipase D/nuclease [Thiomonas arsenitoxydans]CQR34704.1 putative Phospholipase D/nuclease [Thiomonas arsenitoxydans]
MSQVLAALGILHETAEQTRIITPYADGLKAFEAFLAGAAAPGAKLRTMIYGCTLQPFFDALIEAHRCSADVKVIFDHTQATGRAEAPQIERLCEAGLVDGEHFLIGTSPVHHQIVHLKATVIWTPDGKVGVEDGSWNYSTNASQQMNDLCFTASPGLADYYTQAFERLWAWVLANEPQYQGDAR